MLNLKGAGAAGSAFGWSVLNNVWNPGAMRPGIDYTITGTYNPVSVTQGARFAWDFPDLAGPSAIRAYPALIYGSAPKHMGGIGAVFPLQVGDIASLTSGYDVAYSGGSSGYNVGYDIWLTSVPGGRAETITNELMIWLHKGDFSPAGTKIGTYRDGDFSGTIYHSSALNYTAIVSDTDRRAGTVDIAAMLRKLQSMGIVSPSEYVADIELGAEVAHGSGSLVFNNMDIRAQTQGLNGPAIKKAVTGLGVFDNYIQGGAGDDKIVAPTGTSLIDGGAGVDTVVFQGASTAFNVTQNTDGTLTVAGMGSTATLLNDQYIAFTDRTISTTRLSTVAMDFNADRSGDILWRHDDGRILIWDMRQGAFSTAAMLSNPGANWSVKATGDFNGDGAADLVLQSESGQAMLWCIKGNKVVYSGPAILASTNAVIDSPGTGWQVAGSGDFNGDGNGDILWQNGSQIQIWMMNGNVVGAAHNLAGPGAGWRVAGIGDFNADRKSDILWQDGNNNLQLWTMDGGTVQSSASAGNLGAGVRVVATGDFNGDGKTDLLTQVANGPAGIWLMNGAQKTYAGLVTDTANKALGRPGTNWAVAGAGDYNGDGKTDILWENDTGALQTWIMSGQTRLSALNINSQSSTAWHAVTGV